MEDFSKIKQLAILQNEVETRKSVYNERLLAELHDRLVGESSRFYIDLAPSKETDTKQFIDALYHVARRLKDCANVMGVVIPAIVFQGGGEVVQSFTARIASKHPQYRYFVHKKDWVAENCKDFIAIP